MENELSCHGSKDLPEVKLSLPFEVFAQILPDLLLAFIQYRFDCLMNGVDKCLREHFPNKNDDTPEEGKDE